MRGAEAEQGLERSHGCLTTIVAKNELIKIDLQLIAAYAVIGSGTLTPQQGLVTLLRAERRERLWQLFLGRALREGTRPAEMERKTAVYRGCRSGGDVLPSDCSTLLQSITDGNASLRLIAPAELV
jgi:hypothetical protein